MGTGNNTGLYPEGVRSGLRLYKNIDISTLKNAAASA